MAFVYVIIILRKKRTKIQTERNETIGTKLRRKTLRALLKIIARKRDIKEVVKRLVDRAFQENNQRAYKFLLKALNDPELASKAIEDIAYYAFKDRNKKAQRLLRETLKNPNLASYVIDIIAFHAFQKGNHYAHRLLLESLNNPYLVSHVIDAIAYYAFKYGHEHAYKLVLETFENPDLGPHVIDAIAFHVFYGNKKAYQLFLKSLDDPRLVPHAMKKIVEYASYRNKHFYKLFLKSLDDPGLVSHLVEAIETSYKTQRRDIPTTKNLISLIYQIHSKIGSQPKIEEIVYRAMKAIYMRMFGKEPPVPGHPSYLPKEIRHEAFKNKQDATGITLKVSDGLLRELKELGFSIKAVYDVHNIIDTLKNHRRELIDRLTANLPDEEKKTKTKELNKKIDRILPQLTMIASWLGTKRVILDFYLKAVPKKPLEYVGARIRASSDCTVPSSPYAGFERHTVPTFFSSNAGVYAIMATLTDTVKIKKKGKVKTRIRVRKNRHVGNVYFSVHTKADGSKVLYIHGVQLGSLYRGIENVGIAEGLIKGIVDTAKRSGFDEVWIQTRDLSNYELLKQKLLGFFKRMGAERVTRKEVETLQYHDLPTNYYASPSKVNTLLKLRLKKKESNKVHGER